MIKFDDNPIDQAFIESARATQQALEAMTKVLNKKGVETLIEELTKMNIDKHES